MTDRTEEIRARLEGYLAGGGLFNPELADHDAVRDLIIDCRELIETLAAERDRQYDENVNRIAAEGAALVLIEDKDAEMEIERLRNQELAAMQNYLRETRQLRAAFARNAS